MKTVRESTTLYNFLRIAQFILAVDGKQRCFALFYHRNHRTWTYVAVICRTGCSNQGNDGHHLQPDDESDRRWKRSFCASGRTKINKREWAGNASAWHDTPAVARDLSHGLSFAEQVVSEAHSAIVILDSRGIFNASIAYVKITQGWKNTTSLGKACLNCLWAVVKLRHPCAITVYFFEAAMHMKSNCGYQHVKASGCFCFAINFSTAAVAKTRFFNLFRYRHYRRAPRSGATAYSGKYRQYHRTAES